jgi:hypothetical protein
MTTIRVLPLSPWARYKAILPEARDGVRRSAGGIGTIFSIVVLSSSLSVYVVSVSRDARVALVGCLNGDCVYLDTVLRVYIHSSCSVTCIIPRVSACICRRVIIGWCLDEESKRDQVSRLGPLARVDRALYINSALCMVQYPHLYNNLRHWCEMCQDGRIVQPGVSSQYTAPSETEDHRILRH